MINILLVDDHKIIRTGLHRVLNDVKDFKVIAEANSGEQALEFIKKFHIDVVIMDIVMQGIDGLETTRRILKTDPRIKIIILSGFAQDPYPHHLMNAGAKGYLTKECPCEEIAKAIYKVSAGGIYTESKVARQLALRTANKNKRDIISPFSALSEREIQIVLMILEPYPLVEIAEKLHISKKTVTTYRYRLLQKLGIRSNVELMQLAIRYDMLLNKPIELR